MTARKPARRNAPIAVALCLALAACTTATPSTSPTEPTAAPTPTIGPTLPPATPTLPPRPAAEVYADIRTGVEAIRGLKPTAAVDPILIDETQLRANLTAEFDATQTPAKLKEAEDLLITLGLLPKGASLRAITLDFQAGQVAGYYSPEKDELFVVNRTGGLGPVDEVTYSHEFTHQLQDQHFKLEALGIDIKDQSDRSLARLALVEGDAVSVQNTWTRDNLNPEEMGQLFAAAMDPDALAALQRAPRYMLDTSLFPYQDGAGLVARLILKGGYDAVDAAFADPPDSTEQVLHPDKYLAREEPVKVTLPKALFDGVSPEWTEAGQDTLGELILRIWLNEGGAGAAASVGASAGWGGDRVALLRGPGGALSVLMHTEWDTPADADAFAAAATSAIARISPSGRVEHKPGSKTVWVAIGEGAITIVTVAAGGA